MAHQISIIIPVLNEALTINRTLKHLSGLHAGSEFETIVADGDPGGSTIRHISGSKIKSVITPRNRAIQMNRGALAADGKILLFLHADTRLAPDAPAKIIAAMKGENVAGGAFSLGIDSARPVFRLIEKATSFRSRLTKIPYGDQAVFLSRKLFFRLGGFREIPLMEDVDLMRRIKKTGGKIVILPDKALTSARRWEKEGVLYCSARNRMLSTLYLLGVSPDRLVKYYRS